MLYSGIYKQFIWFGVELNESYHPTAKSYTVLMTLFKKRFLLPDEKYNGVFYVSNTTRYPNLKKLSKDKKIVGFMIGHIIFNFRHNRTNAMILAF